MPELGCQSIPGRGGWVLRRSGEERGLRNEEIRGVGQSGKRGDKRTGRPGETGRPGMSGKNPGACFIFCLLT